jgi:protocatechuate 3,4-dioxygenase beta subunit
VLVKAVLSAIVVGSLLTAAVATQTPRDTLAAAPQAGEGSIGGLVIVAGSVSTPVRRARVILRGEGAREIEVADTDANGRYRFAGLPSGSYRVQVEKPGFVSLEYGAKSPAVPPSAIALAARQSFIADFALPRGAALEGTVTNESGEPLIGAAIWADRLDDSGGTRQGVPARQGLTDDLGHYRVHSLPPGDYLVRASAYGTTYRTDNPARGRYTTTYFPGATILDDARPITLGPGEEATAIDFSMVNEPGLPSAQSTGAPPRPARSAAAQRRPPDTVGSIAGRVTAAVTGRPLAGATVRAVSYEVDDPLLGPFFSVNTDAGGEFLLTHLLPGRYYVFVSRGPYLDLQYGQRRPVDTPSPIDLRAGERFGNADVALPSPLVIEGAVIDELGDPVPNVTVSANMHEFIIGGYRLMAAPSTERWPTTDDRGQFRIVVTKRGSYYLSARPGTIRETRPVGGFALTYFPGTANLAEARLLDVDVGQELSGLTITMATARTARISGVVVGASGPVSNTPVLLLPQGRPDVPTPFQPAVTTTDTFAGGAFTFRNVPPGAYVVQASGGTTPVTIDGFDQDDVVVRITAGAYARGRLVFDDRGLGPAPGESVQIRPHRADLNTASTVSTAAPRSVANADGTFVVGPLFGNALMRLSVDLNGRGSPWRLRRVRLGGRDITDEPIDFQPGDVDGLEIELTRRLPVVEGTVLARPGRQAFNYRVIVFSTDRKHWWVGSRFFAYVLSGNDGRFRIAGLPAGDYYVIALTRTPPPDLLDWDDPRYLEQASVDAVRLTLVEGEIRTVQLPLQYQLQ